jgi:hypothetical protein
MCVDENGQQHEYSVPPPLIRKELIAEMRAEAQAIMPPQFLDCIDKMVPFFTPIYDFSTPQLVFGRVVLVGDAASSARPHMGFGMAKAGGDAQALAQALGSHVGIDDGLAAYNRIRQPIGERIMLHGRKLGAHLGVNLQTDEERAMWKLHSGVRGAGSAAFPLMPGMKCPSGGRPMASPKAHSPAARGPGPTLRGPSGRQHQSSLPFATKVGMARCLSVEEPTRRSPNTRGAHRVRFIEKQARQCSAVPAISNPDG